MYMISPSSVMISTPHHGAVALLRASLIRSSNMLPIRRGILATSCTCKDSKSLPVIIGCAAFICLNHLLCLLKAGANTSVVGTGLHRFLFEAFLQILLDLRQLCLAVQSPSLLPQTTTPDPCTSSNESLNVVWGVIAVGIHTACQLWETGTSPSSPLSASSTAKTLTSKVSALISTIPSLSSF